jgi:hypothetical protein
MTIGEVLLVVFVTAIGLPAGFALLCLAFHAGMSILALLLWLNS